MESIGAAAWRVLKATNQRRKELKAERTGGALGEAQPPVSLPVGGDNVADIRQGGPGRGLRRSK